MLKSVSAICGSGFSREAVYARLSVEVGCSHM